MGRNTVTKETGGQRRVQGDRISVSMIFLF